MLPIVPRPLAAGRVSVLALRPAGAVLRGCAPSPSSTEPPTRPPPLGPDRACAAARGWWFRGERPPAGLVPSGGSCLRCLPAPSCGRGPSPCGPGKPLRGTPRAGPRRHAACSPALADNRPIIVPCPGRLPALGLRLYITELCKLGAGRSRGLRAPVSSGATPGRGLVPRRDGVPWPRPGPPAQERHPGSPPSHPPRQSAFPHPPAGLPPVRAAPPPHPRPRRRAPAPAPPAPEAPPTLAGSPSGGFGRLTSPQAAARSQQGQWPLGQVAPLSARNLRQASSIHFSTK
jgi:hypothetical protein